MSLREVCDAFLRAGAPPLKVARLAAGEDLARRFAATFPRALVDRPPGEDLDAVAARLDAALAAGHPLPRRDLRFLPWCLWTGASPLARRPGRLDAVLATLAARPARRPLVALATAWATLHDPSLPGFAAVARLLADHRAVLGPPWSSAADTLALFDAGDGPARLAADAHAHADTPDDALARAGFDRAADLLGLRKAAFRAGFDAFAAEAGVADPLDRLERLRRWAFDADGRVRFEELRGTAVTALLAPWRSADPAKAVRQAHLDLVMALLGDPRSEPMRWNGCAAAEAVVRRWLTEFTLRQFFDVVDAVAPDPHWKYRRAFWNALLDKELIDEAWVVLEETGAATARRLFGDGVAFARFAARAPTLPGQAALIMRIGTLTAVEWSHTSPISMWDHDRETGAPPLDRDVYDPSELKKKDTETGRRKSVFKHVDPPEYIWQREVAEYLRLKRALDISLADYVVDW